MIEINDKTVHVEGDPTDITAELGGVMVGVYRIARDELGEKLALGLMVKLVQGVIQHEKIRTTDILEAIRTVEEVEDVL